MASVLRQADDCKCHELRTRDGWGVKPGVLYYVTSIGKMHFGYMPRSRTIVNIFTSLCWPVKWLFILTPTLQTQRCMILANLATTCSTSQYQHEGLLIGRAHRQAGRSCHVMWHVSVPASRAGPHTRLARGVSSIQPMAVEPPDASSANNVCMSSLSGLNVVRGGSQRGTNMALDRIQCGT